MHQIFAVCSPSFVLAGLNSTSTPNTSTLTKNASSADQLSIRTWNREEGTLEVMFSASIIEAGATTVRPHVFAGLARICRL